MARPSKFNEALKETMIKLYKKGRTDAQVAATIGVSTRTINNWKGKNHEFLHSLKDAKFVADGLVEASLFGRACGFRHLEEIVVWKDGDFQRTTTVKNYPPDTAAAIFWLKNRQPEMWRENYELDINDMDKKSDQELDERIQRLLELKALEKGRVK